MPIPEMSVSVKMSTETLRQIAALAKQWKCSYSEAVRRAIEIAIDQCMDS